MFASVLISGEALNATPSGQPIDNGLISPNSRYQLLYQTDGNIVLYDLNEKPRTVAQNGGTNHNIKGKVSFATIANADMFNGNYNGQLVIVDNGKVYWHTLSKGPENCNLYLTDEGNLYYATSINGEQTEVDITKGCVVKQAEIA